jgi:hypothetical protein
MAINLTGGLPPEILGQQQQLNRQQQMAQMLMQQGTQQPQGQMVSGRYVQPSIFASLAPLAQLYAGQKIGERSDKQLLDLAEQLRKGKDQETQAIMEQLKPRDVQTEMAGPYGVSGSGQNVPMPVATQTLPPDIQAATNLALQSRFGAGKELLPTLIQRSLPEPVKPTTDIQNYEFARSQGYKGSLNDFKNQVSPIEKERLALDREKFEFDKSQKGAGKDLTESQGKASAFQSQMVSASNAVNTLEAQGFDPTSFRSQTAVKLAGGAANPLIPVVAQQYKQAQDQWSEAYLRFKTGAAATEPEVVRNNRTFFPVFGDKPEQIAQKAAAREQAERDIGIAAGRGANLGAQAIGQQPRQPAAPKPAGLPSQSAIDAELKRRGL